MNKKIGIYPGTFDPITFGHVDIIKRSLKIVDELIISIANNPNKKPLFSIKDRFKMIANEIKAEDTSILSANGSRNFPSGVTILYFRA